VTERQGLILFACSFTFVSTEAPDTS
jgi:hypothetical protein